MNKVLVTVICDKVPGVMMLHMFVTISGSQMIGTTFIDASGVEKLREATIHTEINERHMREFFAEQLVKRL